MKAFYLILLFCSFNFVNGQEDELYLNYLTAIYNESTFQYYTVIKYKNLNTSEIREICVQGEDVRHALRGELNLDRDGEDYDKLQKILKDNTNRYFEFKNAEAISLLESEKYSLKELKKLEKKVNFDKLAKKIKKTKTWKNFILDAPLILYAHALFNRGILTGENNCLSGELHYVDRNNQF